MNTRICSKGHLYLLERVAKLALDVVGHKTSVLISTIITLLLLFLDGRELLQRLEELLDDVRRKSGLGRSLGAPETECNSLRIVTDGLNVQVLGEDLVLCETLNVLREFNV